MEKLGVVVDEDKVKEAQTKKPKGPKMPKEALPETNVPWDPERGTEPYEKRPEPKKAP